MSGRSQETGNAIAPPAIRPAGVATLASKARIARVSLQRPARVSRRIRSMLAGRRTVQGARRLATMMGAGFALTAVLRAGGIRVNLSPSIPVGIYLARVVSHPMGTLPRGTLVSACLPHQTAAWGEARGYLMRGSCADGTAPVGKPIFAFAGDTVTVGPNGLARNSELVPSTAPLRRDRHGRPLPRSHGVCTCRNPGTSGSCQRTRQIVGILGTTDRSRRLASSPCSARYGWRASYVHPTRRDSDRCGCHRGRR